MTVYFYKGNLNFSLCRGDYYTYNYGKSIKRISNALSGYVGKKTNVIINKKDAHKIFIKNLIYFCKLEGIDHTQILEIEVIQKQDGDFRIIVNKGIDDNVQILGIK